MPSVWVCFPWENGADWRNSWLLGHSHTIFSVLFVLLVTCRIHSESSKALRKESSESDEVALGAQALSSFLNEAFTCRVSAKSTGTSSQFRQESSLRPCIKSENKTETQNITCYTQSSVMTFSPLFYYIWHLFTSTLDKTTETTFKWVAGFMSTTTPYHDFKGLNFEKPSDQPALINLKC